MVQLRHLPNVISPLGSRASSTVAPVPSPTSAAPWPTVERSYGAVAVPAPYPLLGSSVAHRGPMWSVSMVPMLHLPHASFPWKPCQRHRGPSANANLRNTASDTVAHCGAFVWCQCCTCSMPLSPGSRASSTVAPMPSPTSGTLPATPWPTVERLYGAVASPAPCLSLLGSSAAAPWPQCHLQPQEHCQRHRANVERFYGANASPAPCLFPLEAVPAAPWPQCQRQPQEHCQRHRGPLWSVCVVQLLHLPRASLLGSSAAVPQHRGPRTNANLSSTVARRWSVC